MATSEAFTSQAGDWAAVLGSVKQYESERPTPYGVAVQSALDDLEAAAARGRAIAPLLSAATRAGASSEDIFQALGAVKGSGAQAPPL